MEQAGSTTRVAFDKTGTLTEGTPRLAEIRVLPGAGLDRDEVLALAAAAENPSEHPLGRAVVAAARAAGLPLAQAREFTAVPGRGVTARVSGRLVEIGSPAHLLGATPTRPALPWRTWNRAGRPRPWSASTAGRSRCSGSPTGSAPPPRRPSLAHGADRRRPDPAHRRQRPRHAAARRPGRHHRRASRAPAQDKVAAVPGWKPAATGSGGRRRRQRRAGPGRSPHRRRDGPGRLRPRPGDRRRRHRARRTDTIPTIIALSRRARRVVTGTWSSPP